MNKKQYTLYIGSNNETGELESEAIKLECSDVFHGYTYQEGQGVWEDISEKCAIVTVIADDEKEGHVIELAQLLKDTLHQQAILYTVTDVREEMI